MLLLNKYLGHVTKWRNLIGLSGLFTNIATCFFEQLISCSFSVIIILGPLYFFFLFGGAINLVFVLFSDHISHAEQLMFFGPFDSCGVV